MTLSSAHKLLRIVDFGTSDGQQFNLNKIETTIDYYIAFIDIEHRQSGIAKYTFGLLTSCPRVVTTLMINWVILIIIGPTAIMTHVEHNKV